MNSLFFWIIVLSFVVPAAMRMYRKSVRRRNQEQSFSGRYPEQFPGAGPGQQSNQPRDGYTQQDYMSGGFRQIGSPQPLPPVQPLPPLDQPFPPYGQPTPSAPEDRETGQEPRQQPAPPAAPLPPSAPQGYRARKLAELDQQYSNGELAMEDYMARRAEIMNG